MGHVVKAILSPISNLVSGGSKPAPQPLPSYKNAGGDIVNQTQDVGTRENKLKQQAAASGAERTDNQADLLGNVRPPKKRSAAQSLMG